MSDTRSRQVSLAKQFVIEDRLFREKWEEMFLPYDIEEKEEILEMVSVLMYDDNEKAKLYEEISLSEEEAEKQALLDYIEFMNELVEKWSETLGLEQET